MATNFAARYGDGFDFSSQTDEDLRVTFDLWAPECASSEDWAALFVLGRKAIVEEAHARALSRANSEPRDALPPLS